MGAEADLEQGPALRGSQGRPVLPALRHVAVEPRGRAGLPGRDRPERLRALPRDRPAGAAEGRRRADRLDDDPVDARLERRGRGRPRPDLRPRAGAGRRPRARRRRGAGHARARRGRGDPRPLPRRRARRRALRGAVLVPAGRDLRAARAHRAARRLRHRRRRLGPRPHRRRVRRGRLPPRAGGRAHRRQPGEARRHLRRAHRPVRRALRQGRRRGPRRGPARARQAAARRGLRARLPALLALRHAAALLRQAVLVHRDLEDPRHAAGLERPDRLAPAAHQGGALRRLAARATSTGR